MTRSALFTAVLIASLGTTALGQQESSNRPILDQFRRALLGDPAESVPGYPTQAGPSAANKTGAKQPVSSGSAIPNTTTKKSPGNVPTSGVSGSPAKRIFDPFGALEEKSSSQSTPAMNRDVAQPAKTSGSMAAPGASSRRRVPPPESSTASRDSNPELQPTLAKPKADAGRVTAAAPRGPTTNDKEPRIARAEKFFTSADDVDPKSVAPAAKPAVSADIVPARTDDRLHVTRKSPVLNVETAGPKRITVGKESTYVVSMKNSGDLAANDVNVFVSVPAWAEVVEAQGAAGSVERTPDGLQWKVGGLSAQSQLDLTLKIVPRKSQSFDLGVRWTSAAVTSQATVEVAEAKLQMAISGPSEVTFGQQQLYKLSITNPGNADAENVVLHLAPLSPGDGAAASHRVGTLHAGTSTSVEIELTARQPGKLSIKAEATADGDLRAAAAEEVLVRRAVMQVTVSGPKAHYCGVPLNYDVRVSNTGDAPARHVGVTAVLPVGAEVVSVTQEHQGHARNGEVAWELEQLAPGAEQVFHLRCAMKTPGANRVEVIATGDGDIKGAAVATTQLMALADLALSVSDSPGPIPVGQEMAYEVRIRNRGSSAADNVEVVAFFSAGIEPVAVEGGLHEVASGAVIFKAIPSLGPGAEQVYKIKARAATAGNHRIRVELECRALGTKLSQEDTTLFYGEETAQ